MSSQTLSPHHLTNTLALLTFTVAGQTYSLSVTSVVRIIEMVAITYLADLPDAIQGIINLQGKAVPVMDLRRRFGLPPQAYGLHTPIILADAGGDGRMLGFIVDAVEDVVRVPRESLEITDTFIPTELADQMAAHTAYLAGVAKINRRMLLVLDVRALLTPTGQTKLGQALDQHRVNQEDDTLKVAR